MRKLMYSVSKVFHTDSTSLHDQMNFYSDFERDLNQCKTEALIECPFITSNRVASLLPIFEKMRSRGVRIIVNTRHHDEHEYPYNSQAESAIATLQALDVTILFTGKHHRKLAILDNEILWEGSLNILSHSNSCEVMRRTQSKAHAMAMRRFINIDKHI